MTGQDKRKAIDVALEEVEEEVWMPNGYDDAIIGVMERAGGTCPIVAYDREAGIKITMGDSMTREEAEEFFEFNVVGAWMGEGTPCFIKTVDNIMERYGMEPEPECDHEWVCADNEVVTGCEACLKCKTIRAAPKTEE